MFIELKGAFSRLNKREIEERLKENFDLEKIHLDSPSGIYNDENEWTL